MTAVTEIKAKPAPPATGLKLLREPFPPHQISKLPKPTARQTQIVKDDFSKGIRCNVCGAWHHKDVVHLDYVGHAALTDRLLDCDPAWNWEPVATRENGTPLTDENGGMWIRLTVCGVTRLGYGHPDGKKGGDAIKELIGDALRNAAMRFGAALGLWHKGDLHADEEPTPAPAAQAAQRQQEHRQPPRAAVPDAVQIAVDSLRKADTLDALASIWRDLPTAIKTAQAVILAKDARKAELTPTEIPY